MNRHKSYDKELAKDLQDLEFAREFMLGLMEGKEGMAALDALKHTIRRMGIKEFAKAAEVPYESICRMLESKKIPKIDTLDRCFAVFGLRVKIVLEKVA